MTSEIKQRQMAVTVVEAVPDEHRPALKLWVEKLLQLRHADLTRFQKAKAAIAVTHASRVIWPAIKIAASKMKQIGWDDRSLKARVGMGAAAVGAAVFGGKAAGIAALGTAIGVPLWIVFGAGASFAAGIIEEITRRKPAEPKTTYTVIDADRE